jgi:hypothetical protein
LLVVVIDMGTGICMLVIMMIGMDVTYQFGGGSMSDLLIRDDHNETARGACILLAG